MWRMSLCAGYRSVGCRIVGIKGLWGSRVVRTCSTPAIPAGRITALQAVDLWTNHFVERGVMEPDHSSLHILAYLLGAKTINSLERGKLSEFLSPEKTEQMWRLCSRRLSRMPVQYVIEEWDFRDLTLKMRPPVFIPRPETEELVELVLTDVDMRPGTGAGVDAPHTCLEVGCGSGAIALSLLKSLPQLKVIALDQSQDAVDLTGENALSNPPYLFSEDMDTLEPEIFRFEDHAALDGGIDGLKVIKQILTLAPQILSNHGRVYLEVDPRHPPLIRRWVEANVEEMRYVETRHDVSGRPRFCILRKEKSNKDHKLDLD
ncbi:MTRF1L release factor glutamine methyltransferase isoform X2 [Gasterosteus aculeatus]|uniref:MTRF1L release factor glutamine methyltransferase isoform X2 n=1 Tax=Gasterosteus aculeatus aculeatus TaxID=481459 RepID=UPI001A99C986|nr:MTRF1L release factor glutamine methyltransferase isoform X2 [Gasterosteus aculeatus aculeatus]